MAADIAVVNARLRGSDGLFSITVEDGLIRSIDRSRVAGAERTIDAAGGLVTESFVVSHLHLDKVYTGGPALQASIASYQRPDMRTLDAIDAASSVKRGQTEGQVLERARRLLREAVAMGVTHVRAFCDTDTKAKLTGLRALLRLKLEFAESLHLQVVAFPQDGVERDPGAEEYVRQAVELGADVVGGIPWTEKAQPARRSHINKMLDIAEEYERPVGMLVDDAPDARLRTLEMLAKETIRRGLENRVQACHARAMSAYPQGYARSVARLCRRAGIGLTVSPHTGPACARVDLLMEEGVTVSLGQDDCDDGYYPYGRCNMLEVAFLSSHILRMMTAADMEALYDMVTINAAKVIGVEGFGLKPHNGANMVVLGKGSVKEAMSSASSPLWVVKDGRVTHHPSD